MIQTGTTQEITQASIGAILRRLRKHAGLSIRQATAILREEYGRKLSDKTLYSYETNTRSLHADLFLDLCQLYGCNSILETFTGVFSYQNKPDVEEWTILQKLRSLEPHDRSILLAFLDLVQEKELRAAAQLQAVAEPPADAYQIRANET